MTFELDRFIDECRAANAAGGAHTHVREVVARAVSEPAAVLQALGAPARAGLHALHRSPELTILNVVWAPMMTVPPHDHRMWAVIGIYSGREDNIFWRRLPGGRKVEAAGAKALAEKDAEPLGRDIVHSVTNPIPRFTGALHVYGGDFFEPAGRSEWNPETLLAEPFDAARAARRFQEADAAFGARTR